MHIIRFLSDDGLPHTGEPLGDQTARLLDERLRPTKKTLPIRRLLAPIEPTQVICIGRNFPAPNLPADVRAPENLEVFLKPTSAVIGPDAEIHLPRFFGDDPTVVAEGELAIVIGTTARHVPEASAARHVLGFTIGNDLTALRWQTPAGPPLWMRGKGFDTFCPLGPAIVTIDEIPHPSNLTIQTFVAGRPVRRGWPRDMIRSPWRIVSELSAHLTLTPGTVILTGGPPLAEAEELLDSVLKPGDEVIASIDKIGRIVNRVHDAG